MGYKFQAELPPCLVDAKRSGVWSPEDETPRDQLLWKPWDELEESAVLKDQGKCMLNYNFLSKPTLRATESSGT